MVYHEPRRTPDRQIINTERRSARPTGSPDDLTRMVIINGTFRISVYFTFYVGREVYVKVCGYSNFDFILRAYAFLQRRVIYRFGRRFDSSSKIDNRVLYLEIVHRLLTVLIDGVANRNCVMLKIKLHSTNYVVQSLCLDVGEKNHRNVSGK